MESTKARLPVKGLQILFTKVKIRYSSRPQGHSYLPETTRQLPYISNFGITVKQRAEVFQISLIEACVFALIFQMIPGRQMMCDPITGYFGSSRHLAGLSWGVLRGDLRAGTTTCLLPRTLMVEEALAGRTLCSSSP